MLSMADGGYLRLHPNRQIKEKMEHTLTGRYHQEEKRKIAP